MVAASAALVVAGCGDDDDDGGAASTPAAAETTPAAETTAASGVDPAVAADVAKLLERPTDIGIKTPLEGGVPKGKNIVFIQCGFPDCAAIGDSMQEVVDLVGWKMTRLPTEFTPESIKATWQEIVRRKPDAVVTTGSFEQSIYRQELAKVQEMDIPIVGMAEAEEKGPWLVSLISAETYTAGPAPSIVTNAAKYITTKLPEGGKVLAVNHPGVVIIETMVDVFKTELQKDCPKCEYVTTDIPAASIGKDAGAKLATYLQTHNDIKYIFLTTPDVTVGLDAALKGAGVDPVPIISSNTNPASLDRLQKGEAGLAASVPTPFGGEAEWRAVDALSRHWAGQSVDEDRDATMPHWIIEAGKVPDQRPMPMVEDYQAQFKKLWGIS